MNKKQRIYKGNTKTFSRRATLALVLSAALVLGACTSADDAAKDPQEQAAEKKNEPFLVDDSGRQFGDGEIKETAVNYEVAPPQRPATQATQTPAATTTLAPKTTQQVVPQKPAVKKPNDKQDDIKSEEKQQPLNSTAGDSESVRETPTTQQPSFAATTILPKQQSQQGLDEGEAAADDSSSNRKSEQQTNDAMETPLAESRRPAPIPAPQPVPAPEPPPQQTFSVPQTAKPAPPVQPFPGATTTTLPEFDDATQDNIFKDYGVRPFVETEKDSLSTFAADVDTASYSVARQWLAQKTVPPAASVRPEEYINSFDYNYPAPESGIDFVADGGRSPFDEDNVLLRLGVQAERVDSQTRSDAALTFVIDTSGSMSAQSRMGLVQTSLLELVDQLDDDDSIAIVGFSDDASTILEPTKVSDSAKIKRAINDIVAKGDTNLEAGLKKGYELADEAFVEGGTNRVILASDGVANVGLRNHKEILQEVHDDAEQGIQLVSVGVGMGNFNDELMEQLANEGDGFYSYIDTQAEAEKLFTEDLLGSLVTVAFDAKIQVDFDDEVVEKYRLIGFENRGVADSDFRDDNVDAGELGSGHQVTAIYELKLAEGLMTQDSLGTAQLRWKNPETKETQETELDLVVASVGQAWEASSTDYKLAVTAAAFAEVLRESPFADGVSFEQVQVEAERLAEERNNLDEFVLMVSRARDLAS